MFLDSVKKSKVRISYMKVDSEARSHRQTADYTGNSRVPHVVERSLETMWMDVKPKHWNFLDWWRAWNHGNPAPEHVALYNSLHPDENEQIVAEEVE